MNELPCIRMIRAYNAHLMVSKSTGTVHSFLSWPSTISVYIERKTFPKQPNDSSISDTLAFYNQQRRMATPLKLNDFFSFPYWERYTCPCWANSIPWLTKGGVNIGTLLSSSFAALSHCQISSNKHIIETGNIVPTCVVCCLLEGFRAPYPVVDIIGEDGYECVVVVCVPVCVWLGVIHNGVWFTDGIWKQEGNNDPYINIYIKALSSLILEYNSVT